MSLKPLVVDVCTEAFINQNNYSNKLVVLNHQGTHFLTPRLSILLCLTPDDFSRQWGTPGSQWVTPGSQRVNKTIRSFRYPK